MFSKEIKKNKRKKKLKGKKKKSNIFINIILFFFFSFLLLFIIIIVIKFFFFLNQSLIINYNNKMLPRLLRKNLLTTITIILILYLNECNAYFLDYTPQYLLDCKKKDYNSDQIKNTLILHEIDRYLMISLGPIAVLCSLFIILTFLIFGATRHQPQDIIFGISLSDFFLSIHWIMSSIFMI